MIKGVKTLHIQNKTIVSSQGKYLKKSEKKCAKKLGPEPKMDILDLCPKMKIGKKFLQKIEFFF